MEVVRIDRVMTRDVKVVEPTCPLRQVASLMRDHRLSTIVVCERGKPVGVVAAGDLVSVFADGDDWEKRTAGDTMSSAALRTLTPDATVEDALRLATLQPGGDFSVVDGDGRLVGTVAHLDLLRARDEGLEREQVELERRLAEEAEALRVAEERERQLSLQDELLGIGNRRAMELAIGHSHEIARRYGRPYAIGLVDVDHFRAYQEGYGQGGADVLLQRMTERFRTQLRGADTLYRYGGDALIVLFEETTLEHAQIAAERLRSCVEKAAWPNRRSPLGVVTVSIGVGAFETPSAVTWHPVLEAANRALAVAKESGRNRVGGDPLLKKAA